MIKNTFLNLKSNKIIIIFFIIYFMLALCFVGDYGISTDEPQERKTMYVNLNYILTNLGRDSMDVPELETYKDKYYGMVLQFPMCIFEVLTKEVPKIYLYRHIYTFFICYLGCIVFFFIGKKLFKSNYLAFLGTLMLMFYPRFMAEQFYNLKDMFFMSAFIISMWATIMIIESNFSKRWILLFSFIVAVTTNVRIVGVIFIILLFGYIFSIYLFQNFFRNKVIHNELNLVKIVKIILSITSLFLIVFIISIPAIWENPAAGIVNVFARFSDYPGGGNVVFMNKVMENTEIPWFYIPIWIFISVPLWYIFFFILGVVFLMKESIYCFEKKSLFNRIYELRYIILILLLLVVPWCGMVLNKSNLYNGWRHCYFMLPPIILLSIYGIKNLFKYCKLSNLITIIILINFVWQTNWIIHNHPYEMVYFNSIGKKYASQFDRDYWHLSELQAWKYISHIDNNATITVNTSGFQFFANILSENEKKRIQIAEDPMYYIETYRGITGNEIELEGYDEIYSIIVDNFKVATIFKKK